MILLLDTTIDTEYNILNVIKCFDSVGDITTETDIAFLRLNGYSFAYNCDYFDKILLNVDHSFSNFPPIYCKLINNYRKYKIQKILK